MGHVLVVCEYRSHISKMCSVNGKSDQESSDWLAKSHTKKTYIAYFPMKSISVTLPLKELLIFQSRCVAHCD